MLTQPKKWPQVLAAIVVVILVYKNPEGAAHLVNHVWTDINTFASGLHLN